MTTLKNARLILDDEIADLDLTIEGERIAALGASSGEVIECAGDFLLPGIVDLHTDNLERQVLPRPNARWPSRSAFLSHDAQCAVAGVTTVFDALSLGDINGRDRIQTFADGLADIVELTEADVLRSDHLLHLRCELIAPELAELLARAARTNRLMPLIRLVSLMDHAPGVGQYADIAKWREDRRNEGMTPARIDAMLAGINDNRNRWLEANRALVLAFCRDRALTLASHDDRLASEVERNHADGLSIAEFPVSLEAALTARRHGMGVIAGAPNIVRGGSHSGNVNAMDLIRSGLVTALASDYVPGAMLEAVFRCVSEGVLDVPSAVALVTSAPAAMVGLADRGRIAVGLRADLVQVRLHDGLPIVRRVWVGGRRVA